MNLSWLTRSQFCRDSWLLIAGAVAAQALALLTMPFITRIYGQEQLGALGAFACFVGLASQLSGLRYEQAIVFAEEREVPSLSQLSALIAFAMAALVGIVIAAGRYCSGFLETVWNQHGVLFLPLSVLLVGAAQILHAKLNRRRAFAKHSTGKIAKSSGEAAGQLGLAAAYGASGYALILGHLTGIAAQAAWLCRAVRRPRLVRTAETDIASIGEVARRYQNFPLYAAPAGLVSVLGQHGLTILIALTAGIEQAGVFFLAHRVLSLPIALISQAICPAVYSGLNDRRESRKDAQSYIASVFIGLLLVGLFPLVALAITGPWLFTVCFGPSWGESGALARAVCPAYGVMFAALPITQAFFVYEKQSWSLLWHLFSLVLRIATVLVAYYVGGLWFALVAYSGATAFSYCVVVVYSLGWAGCPPSKVPSVLLSACLGIRDRLAKAQAIYPASAA